MLLSQAIKKFIEWGNAKYSIYTIKNYKISFQLFENVIKKKNVGTINLKDILLFYRSLKNSGKKDSTIFYYMIAIKQLLKFLASQKVKCFNHQLVPLHKFVCNSWHPAEKEDLTKMLKVLKRSNLFLMLRDELILKFLFVSGVRVSELCDLTLDIIDLKHKEAIIITKKNLLKRVIMWDDITNEVMIEYLEERLNVAKCNFIFISRKGIKLTTRQIERIVKELREKAGILERIVPHSFRHGFGMYGIEKNINLRYLQVLLGHKHLNSSQVYMPYKEQNIRKSYQKIYGSRLGAVDNS